MTAVEYLVSCITKLEWDLLEKKIDCEEYGRTYRQNIEQAKEMERNQRGYTKEDVLKAGEIGEINHHDYKHIVKLLDEARQINETYGSKGSDEIGIMTTENHIDVLSAVVKKHKSSQAEISDEEIHKQADYYSSQFDFAEDSSAYVDFIEGIKWYREQLKKKQ